MKPYKPKTLKKIKNNLKESEILKSIKDYLQYLENQGKLMFIRNNSGAIVIRNKSGSRYITFGKKGSPDLLVWVQGKSIALEVKTLKGRQSASQKEWQSKFEKLGGEYYIVHSIEEVRKIIEKRT